MVHALYPFVRRHTQTGDDDVNCPAFYPDIDGRNRHIMKAGGANFETGSIIARAKKFDSDSDSAIYFGLFAG